ncbi:MAG TPA: HAD family hydrolase [Candidatus Krumholzibacteriaceae bacterium]|nr:HAD family hydrolase [Candidatus Krumholzibacteriaceae bacterium]
MLQGVQLIIYDLDGVLIDSTEAIVEAFELTLREIGVEYEEDKLMPLMGHGLIHILEEVLPEEHRGKEWELRERYIHHFQKSDTGLTKLLPDVEETLRHLKEEGYRQSVATNKTSSEAKRILELLGVDDVFDLVVGFLDVPNAKPAPDMILYTLERLGVDRRHAVFVDDTAFGLKAGVEAGVNTVGILTGYHTREQLEEVQPDYVVDSMHELKRLLTK